MIRVKDVMVGPAVCCNSKTNLGAAAQMMWQQNCGFLPITNIQNKVVGAVTDRDLFIALATRNRLAGDVTVGEVTSGRVFYCKPDDDIHIAMTTMAKYKVRRLPVLNPAGVVIGILSLDDITRSAQMGDRPELSCQDIVRTLRSVEEPELGGVVHQKLAAAA